MAKRGGASYREPRSVGSGLSSPVVKVAQVTSAVKPAAVKVSSKPTYKRAVEPTVRVMSSTAKPKAKAVPAAGLRAAPMPATRPTAAPQRPQAQLDPLKFFGEVQRNAQIAVRGVPVLGNIAAANQGFASLPTGAQSRANNAALRRALGKR